MRRVKKKEGKRIRAWQLGAGSKMERELLQTGKIRRTENGRYELFSQEASNGMGEIAQIGDYFKIDADGFPYPNRREWFEEQHLWAEGDWYEQKPQILPAWRAGDPISEEVQFLLETGRMKLREDEPKRYFEASLWGARLTADRDAVLVFYSVERGENGKVCDADFCFVSGEEFARTYTELS